MGGSPKGSYAGPVRRRQPEPQPALTVPTVIDALGTAFLVDGNNQVVQASPGAIALGLIKERALRSADLLSVVERVRIARRPDSVELLLPQSREFLVHVRPIGDSEFVLGLVEEADEANRIDAMRRDFVANVSHELKTPIGGLSLLAEAISDTASDPEAVVNFADRMRTEVTRLSHLVTDLLALSRLESEDPMYEAVVVSIDDVIDRAVDRCRIRAAHKSIAVVVGGDQGMRVFGNEEQLTVALTNLIINAVTYSPEHTQIGIGIHDREESVEVAISDKGVGIPSSELGRIFERFYRVDPARSRESGGTGLGLAIVKHIVNKHGGSITVWSAENEGSTFTISLPKAE